jgi:tRNA(Arg) A34 adenosine deaminase TadA
MLQLLEKALQIAKESPDQKSFYMACVARRTDGAIVSSVNHSVSSQAIPSHHAEARVLRKCDYGAILYVARVHKDKETIAMAKPCKRCQALIRNYGVKKVYYTIGQNEWGVWIP